MMIAVNKVIPWLAQQTKMMQHAGIRRLLVLAGTAEWSSLQIQNLSSQIDGDWLWVGSHPELPLHCEPRAFRTLLGREFHHAIFDARRGFDATALAALAGTLKAGSWLVLLTPDWHNWQVLPDADSCRWSDTSQAIATPNFISHLQVCVQKNTESLLWRQAMPFPEIVFSLRPEWQSATGRPNESQKEILHRLNAISAGVAVVTAARGRGKSALAGMLISQCSAYCLVTAPAKAATDVLAHYAGDRFHFIAPDALLIETLPENVGWLIVDEAAAIPAPLLRQIIDRFPRVLLITTVQGYEGTGKGFMLKLCASLPVVTHWSLTTPVRWAEDDPLEQIINRIMMFDEVGLQQNSQGEVSYDVLKEGQWPRDPGILQQIYCLLSSAHYRTSPLDWQRMLDAPGQSFVIAKCAEAYVGALWVVAEGGLDQRLSSQVWAGFRRPRGNLVAQSLAAHGGSPLAATLRGRRISRIAVHPQRQRQHIGKHLIDLARAAVSEECDYFSVSFGYTRELWCFWQQCGFKLVRIGTHREASSGCYNAMALLPLSPAGQTLTEHEHQRLIRDYVWQQPWIEQTIFVPYSAETALNDDDWFELAGFAFAHRPVEACLGSINRLLLASHLMLPGLRGRLETYQCVGELCRQLGYSGWKMLLLGMRAEVKQALEQLDAKRTFVLHQAILKIKNNDLDAITTIDD